MISRTNHCRDERHEQDLLLFAHNGLPTPHRWLMEAHLRICPRCREERDRLLSVSRLMAGAVRADAGLPPWRPQAIPSGPSPARLRPSPRAAFTRPLPAWAIALVLALLLAGASVAAALVYGPPTPFLPMSEDTSPIDRDKASRMTTDPNDPNCITMPARPAPATH